MESFYTDLWTYRVYKKNKVIQIKPPHNKTYSFQYNMG